MIEDLNLFKKLTFEFLYKNNAYLNIMKEKIKFVNYISRIALYRRI